MKISAFIAAASVGFSWNTLALADCSAIDNLSSIERPADPQLPSSPRIPFYYRYLRGTDSSQPTVIFLPGGPGQSSITNADRRLNGTYGFIQTDPRGAGCNQHFFAANPKLSTELFASDIVALVRSLSLNNYILYGISYGTILATVTTVKLREAGLRAPKNVVLEGIFGAGYTATESQGDFENQWKRIKGKLPVDTVQKLSQSPLPFGLTSKNWGAWIVQFLYHGRSAKQDNPIPLFLSLLDNPATMNTLKESVEASPSPLPEDFQNVFNTVACSEIFPYSAAFHLDNGELVNQIDEMDICSTVPKTTFQSKKWEMKVPIYYFVGENDPATPVRMAHLHFNGQKKSRKLLVEVLEAGHNPLMSGLSDCSAAIWSQILRNEKNLSTSLSTCKLKSKLHL